jgi:hypothetical protein
MSTITPVTPPELDRVVQRCLAKKPKERWQTLAELIAGLQEIAETVLPRLKAQKRQTAPTEGAKVTESQAREELPLAAVKRSKGLSQLISSHAWKLGFFGLLLAVIVGSLVVRELRQPEKTPGWRLLEDQCLCPLSDLALAQRP